MATITIFEGPDGTGKSTEVDSFCGRLDKAGAQWTKVHWGPVSDPLNDYLKAASAFAQLAQTQPGIHLVMDRWYFSEQVYGPVHRSEDRLGPHHRMLERILHSEHGMVAWCRPPLDQAWEKLTARGIDFLAKDLDTYRALFDHYVARLTRPGLPVLAGNPFETELAGIIYEADQEDRNRIRSPRLFGRPGGGCFREGNILIVGESPGKLRGDWRDNLVRWPFVSPEGSGPWLAEQLELSGVPESSLYFINAWNRKGGTTPPGFLTGLKPSLVCALGSHSVRWTQGALNWLAKEGYLQDIPPVQQVHHPQYHKRFRPRDPYPLVQILKDTEHSQR